MENASKAQAVIDWTNTDVIAWLVKIDQKHVIQPFVEHNITGPLLLAMDVGDGGSACDNPLNLKLRTVLENAAFKETQIAAIAAEIRKLHPKAKEDEEVQKDDSNDKGWTWDNEKRLWEITHDYVCASGRMQVIRTALKKKQEKLMLFMLLISTITSSASLLNAADSSYDEETKLFFKYANVVLSITTTLISGYLKLAKFDQKIAQMDKWNELNDVVGSTLESTGALSKPPDERMQADEGMGAVDKACRDRDQCDNGDIDAETWENTLPIVKSKLPSQWVESFEAVYVPQDSGCFFKRVAYQHLALSDPDAWDDFLVRWSGNKFGKYTLDDEYYRQILERNRNRNRRKLEANVRSARTPSTPSKVVPVVPQQSKELPAVSELPVVGVNKQGTYHSGASQGEMPSSTSKASSEKKEELGTLQ